MPLNAAFFIAGICLLAVIVSGILLLLRKRKQSVPQDIFLSVAQGLSKIEDLARSVEGIRELFLVPRLRGGIGETILEELLKNWLPARGFQTQYPFANGARADAVIKTGGYIIAVDSKFPLKA
jgi:DNA recombination protein RmuC